MTATVSIACTITNAKSNYWGYTGSPLTVTLTDNVETIKQVITSKIASYNRPVSRGSRATKRPEKRAVDFKLITTKVTVTGHLDNTTSGDTAITKKNKLIAMMQSGEFCTFTWRTEVFDGTRVTGTPTVGSPEKPYTKVTGLNFTDNLKKDPANPGTGEAIMTFDMELEVCFARP